MKNKTNLSKELFNKDNYINENTIQNALSKDGGIEFSLTGELIPVELVEGLLTDFFKNLREDLENAQEEYGNLDWVSKEQIQKIIDNLVGDKFK